jgi:RNA polymerase sigma-70 factor (ECF subfamily)
LGGRSRSGPAGVTGGEDDAIITALYQKYRAPLLAFVLRLTGGDRQQAEDVVQETMVRAWHEAGRLDLSGPSLGGGFKPPSAALAEDRRGER